MSVGDLISRMERLGIHLWVENNRLHYDAPVGVMTEVEDKLIQHKSSLLKHLLIVQLSRASAQPPLRSVVRSGNIPLSFVQMRLWLLDQFEPGSSVYNMPYAVRLAGILDVDALKASLNALVERHEILRTSFRVREGVPVQVIAPVLKVVLPVVDMSSLPEDERERGLQKQVRSETDTPFDLAELPLLRARLLRLGENEHVLVLTMHHILSDDWSMTILKRELSLLYGACSQGESSPLPALPVQYADYAIWQRQWLQGVMLEKQISYWREQLKDLPLLDIPTDRPRPMRQSFRGGQLDYELPIAITKGLQELSQDAGVTLFMTLLAAFQLLLQRHSGQDDIVVGCPKAGRSKVELESLIGFFVNTLVLRTDLSGDPTFVELLGRVREMALEAFSHQDVPFDKLVEELQPERVLSRNPLFDVLINFLEERSDTENLSASPNLNIIPVKQINTHSKFTFTLYIRLIKGRLRLNLVYQRDIFDEDRMLCLLQQYRHLLEQIVAMPEQTIQSYSLVTPESGDLLPDPAVNLDEPPQQLVTELFSAAAVRLPGNVAVRHNGNLWSYAELHQASRRMAATLHARVIEPGDVIAVSGRRSFGLIVSLLAALKAGGVILPLDRKLPPARQDVMLREARASVILCVDREVTADFGSGLVVLQVDPETGCLIGQASDGEFNNRELPQLSADNPAYIFFTSGSTGTPKAILGCHKSLSHFLCWQRDRFSIGVEDRVAQLSSLSFDVVLRDIFLPLISGGTLCLPGESDLVNTLRWIEREAISVIHSVPAVTHSWLANIPEDISLRSLRWLFLAGEPLTDALVRQWRAAFPESGAIVNLYGATESTLIKCYCQLGDELEEGVQLAGNAISQTQALVLRDNRQLCGIGETGEIVIRTPFMTLGYLNNQEENRKRFVKNPFRDDEQDLLYFTGDRGRYQPDGKLEILGRFDDQVKIRGIRVEPAEVAAVLSLHEGVKDCTVVAQKDQSGSCALVAYVVPGLNASVAAGELRSDLENSLPDAFIPSAFVFLEQLPLLANGKVDRQALPAVNPANLERGEDFVLPQSPIEKILAGIWQVVLGKEHVGINDNFFALGGNSLLLTQVANRMNSVAGVDIPLADLFRSPTILELSDAVSATLLSAMDQAE